jgi:hypothetical protein
VPARSTLWPPALAVALWWLVAAVASAAAEIPEPAPGWLVVANQALAAPVLAAAVYATGHLLGGRLLGVWFALVLVALAPAGVLYALAPFRDVYVDRVLAAALGLTDDALLASAAALAAAAAFVLASLLLPQRRLPAAALAGAAAGIGMLLEPSAALFLVGAALAYAVCRRPLEASALALAAAPFAVVALIRHGVGFEASWDAFSANMAGLREHLWSNRLLQWLPLAGVVGLARRSLPAAALLGGWFGGFAVAIGASPNLPVGEGEYLEAFVPALPCLAVLVAALPLLVPRLPARLDDRLAAGRS